MDYLVDVVNAFMVRAYDVGVPFPQSQRLWDQLLYELRESGRSDVPLAVKRLEFNWGDRFPSSPELCEVVNGIRGFCSSRIVRSSTQIVIDREIIDLWRKKDIPCAESFLDYAVEQARTVFCSAVRR